jgi:hypothetical protein
MCEVKGNDDAMGEICCVGSVQLSLDDHKLAC